MLEPQEEEFKFIEPCLPQQLGVSDEPKVCYESQFKEQYLKEMSCYMSNCTRQSLLKQLKQYHVYEQTMDSNKHVAFLKIDCSKSCQILELDVKIGFILLKIRIINVQGVSPVHSSQCAGSGGFGKIYKYQSLNSTRAVKCFQVNERSKLQDSLAMAITQYSFLKIASIIQSGPTINRSSFDLYVYKCQLKSKQNDKIEKKYCIQFQTQLCGSCMSFGQQDKASLFKSLYCLHALGITHCDIKPDNIMYSFAHNKWIFIDFGVSCPVKEPIGQNTKTKYRGTLKYNGKEMQKLYKSIFVNKQNQQEFIDLYWNDVQGLQLASIDLHKKNKMAFTQQIGLTNDKSDDKLQQHFLMTTFKYWLYFGSQLPGQYFIQNIQWDNINKHKIIFFLLQLKYIPQKIRVMFVNLVQRSKSEPNELQILQKHLSDVKSSLDYDQQRENNYQKSINPKYVFFKQIPKALQLAQLQDTKNEHLNLLSKNKQIKDLCAYLKNYKIGAQQQKQYYFTMVFNSINFLKKDYNLSIASKVQICKRFHEYYPESKLATNDIGYIKYFIQYILRFCLQNKQAHLLKEYLLEIYSNYLMLGLADIKLIKAVHQTIFSLSSNKIKICQYFIQIYNAYYWRQQQINGDYNQDNLLLREYIVSVMYQIYESLGSPKDPLHQHCNQPYCLQMQSFMLKRIQQQAAFFNSNHQIEQDQFRKKINKCLQTLKSFKTKIKRIGLQKIQITKVINQIPMNIREVFIPQYYPLNPESWSRISFFIQKFIQCEQISGNLAFILKMKMYYYFCKLINDSEIQPVIECCNRNIKRLNTYYEVVIELIYQQQKTMKEYQKQRQYFLAIYLKTFINSGNLFSQDELACFIASLNQLQSRSIWYYLERIYQAQPKRVADTLTTFYARIQEQRCVFKRQYKLLKLSQFVFRRQIKIHQFTVDKQQEIVECKQQRQFLEIKLKYFQAVILTLKQSKDCEKYLLKFYQVVQRNKRYNDYMLKNIIYNVYQELISLLLRSSKIQQAINLILNLSQHLIYLLSKQTSVLNKKIKCLIYNLFVFKSHIYFKYWDAFRSEFVDRSLQRRDKIAIFYNLTIVLVEHRSYQHTKYFYSNNIAALITPKQFKFLSPKHVQRLIYQFAKLFDFKIPIYRQYQIQNYYQVFKYSVQQQQQMPHRKRYIEYLIRLHRKAIINILPLDAPQRCPSFKYFQQDQYLIKIVVRRSKLQYKKSVQWPAKQMFKEKINKIIGPYKNTLKKVKIIK